MPQLPMMAVVTPCQQDGRQVRIPGGLAIEMRVDVHESRCDREAVGIDGPPGRPVNPSDFDDQAILHGDVGGPRRRSRAVDDCRRRE